MKTVVLFGAGQVGAMLARLMGTGYRIACFADNYEGKWGTTPGRDPGGLPSGEPAL